MAGKSKRNGGGEVEKAVAALEKHARSQSLWPTPLLGKRAMRLIRPGDPCSVLEVQLSSPAIAYLDRVIHGKMKVVRRASVALSNGTHHGKEKKETRGRV
ncbi:uncharacterized protein CIMG_02305 [Coccidioides immitis RS]|uniref:Uncharacterized protein n=1 Tax=Coccidioides immitis (strain RS) TaxID=246410 RepID=J3KL32_COCIM|nr:uncharacterized protein CIMG_02305 [Coccidioides immitis RS]EAS36951.3 hypothetical protein CIMG_02305 [Coccidioides immitis RS]